MSDINVVQLIRGEYAVRKEWTEQVQRFRLLATHLETLDPVLGAMCRRIALAIEQFHDRISAHLQVMTYDAIEARQRELDEVNREVDALFARLGAKPVEQPKEPENNGSSPLQDPGAAR